MTKKRQSGSIAGLIEQGFKESVKFKSKGRVRITKRLDVMVMQKVLGAVQGDIPSVKFILKHLKADYDAPKIPQVRVIW